MHSSPHSGYFHLRILSLLFSLVARSFSALAFSPIISERTFLLLGLILYFSPRHNLLLEQHSRLLKIQLVYLAILQLISPACSHLHSKSSSTFVQIALNDKQDCKMLSKLYLFTYSLSNEYLHRTALMTSSEQNPMKNATGHFFCLLF